MTLNKLKRKYFAEGIKLGYKRGLFESYASTEDRAQFINGCVEFILRKLIWGNRKSIPSMERRSVYFYWNKKVDKENLSVDDQINLFDKVDIQNVMETVASNYDDLYTKFINKRTYNEIYKRLIQVAERANNNEWLR